MAATTVQCPFGIMTVDNTSEGPLSYGFPDVLSTASANPVQGKSSSGWPFVDKHRMPAVIHWRDRFCTFLISAFCTNYMRSGILATSVIGCLATTSSPCISILYWSSVMAIASSADLGHRKEPLSSLLYMRRKPSPSHKSALILLFFLPQNKKSVFLS